MARPTDWPGVHCARAMLEGRPMEGVWYDRSGFYEARKQSRCVDLEEFAETEFVHLSPIPCWRGLSEDELTGRLAALPAAPLRSMEARGGEGCVRGAGGAALSTVKAGESEP